MKVAIVGASGVLGRALTSLLIGQGHNVRALSRHPVPAVTRVEPVALDLLNTDADERLRALLGGCHAVVHVATSIPKDPRDAAGWRNNTLLRTVGTRRLLHAAQLNGVAHYVQQSIVMAYADGGDRWLTEDDPIDMSPARAAICGPVAEMEALVRAVQPVSMAWSILRGGSFVGPGTAQESLVEALRTGRATIAGTGGNFLSLVHVDDMAQAVVLALSNRHNGLVVNVCAAPVRQRDYFTALAVACDVPPPRTQPDLPPPPSFRCSTDRARDILGWHPRRSIDELP